MKETNSVTTGPTVTAGLTVTATQPSPPALPAGLEKKILKMKPVKILITLFLALAAAGTLSAQPRSGSNAAGKTQGKTQKTGGKSSGTSSGNRKIGDSSYSVRGAVDLGLSVKWAACNLGADNPDEYGDYYAWGETSPKSNYDESTYRWCRGSKEELTKYCNNSSYGYNGFTDYKTTLDFSDDVVHEKLGGCWRMATDDEWTELRIRCKWFWTGRGYKVTGPNGSSIFLPAAGGWDDTGPDGIGFEGYYYSSCIKQGTPYQAWLVYFSTARVFRSSGNRYYGLSIRPVSE